MISRQMLRLPSYGPITEGHRLEAFAFCYAASYCGQVIGDRMKESYQRAWDFDSWEFHDGIPLGPPGWLITRWDGDFRPKIMISIRGISNWSQLLPIRSGFGASQMPHLPGWAYSPFVDMAQTLWTSIYGNPYFRTVFDAGMIPIVISGFSMGGAIASVLAREIHRISPRRDIRTYTFASPCVGDSGFLANPVSNPVRASYLRDDPIGNFPCGQVARVSIGTPGTIPVPVVVRTEADPDVYDYEGTRDPANFRVNSQILRATSQLTDFPPSPTNLWYYHMMNSYRYAFCNLAERASEADWRWRFRYLEHNDENRWGANFRRASQFTPWGPLVELAGTSPEDVAPDVQPWEQRGYVRPRAELRAMNIRPEFGNNPVITPVPPRRPIRHLP